jgi:hypothetical protein
MPKWMKVKDSWGKGGQKKEQKKDKKEKNKNQ